MLWSERKIMKKLFKFIFKLACFVATGFGIYYAVKKYGIPGLVKKQDDEEEEDLVDDLDEFDLEEDKAEEPEEAPKAPEYVSIMPEDEAPAEEAPAEG